MKIYFWLFVFIIPFVAVGQKTNLDSLIQATENMKDSDTAKAQNYYAIAKAYKLEKIDFANTKKYIRLSIDISAKSKYPAGIFRATFLLGHTYREQGMNTEAIETIRKAADIFEENKELSSNISLCGNHINTYTVIADMYAGLHDFPNAEKNAFKALELSEKYKTETGKCWMALANIFSEQKNIPEAKKYTLKALDYFKQQKNGNDDVARAYAYMARYSYIEEDYAHAIANYQLSLDTYKKTNNVYGIRIDLYNLAQVYAKIDSNDKAEYYLTETLKYTSPSKDAVFISYLNMLHFNLQFAKHNYSRALILCKDILDYAFKEKSRKNIREAYEKYLLIYTATKDTPNAFIMSEKISALKDSVYNADIAKNSADLAKKYETEKKEQQISFLDKENKLNKEKLDKEILLSIALKNENELKEAKLQQELLLRDALSRENNFKDIELSQKQTIQQGMERENILKNKELSKETELNKTLQSQNSLMLKNSKNESRIRWLMLVGLIGFTAFGINYYRNYKKQQTANSKILKQSEELKILMKEVHHRIKNNLQVIAAMLRMQARNSTDQLAIEALMNSENRLQAIAIVHEKLYKSSNISSVSLKEYLQELMDVLSKQHKDADSSFQYKIVDNAGLSTNLDTAIPVGLIVNELVTNSIKYAFNDTKKAEIDIQLNKIDNKYQLAVKDNGKGLPDGIFPINPKSLGLKLVRLFTEQLNGTLKYATENGACYNISF